MSRGDPYYQFYKNAPDDDEEDGKDDTDADQDDFSEMCDLDCGERGHCEGGVCVCDEGWRGGN